MKLRLQWVKPNQGNKVDANVNFDLDIQAAQREEELYAATIKPFYVTGYPDTRFRLLVADYSLHASMRERAALGS